MTFLHENDTNELWIIRLDRGAFFISISQRQRRDAAVKERGKRRRSRISPNPFPGTQEKMLRTVTSVERYQRRWKDGNTVDTLPEALSAVFLFHFIGNFVPCETKSALRDRTAADRRMPLTRPAAGEESRRRESISFYHTKEERIGL